MKLDGIEQLLADGFVRATRHPKLPLTIYNYTAKCQYDQRWCPISRICRGLIIDDTGEVIARPFPKFFNLDEHSRSEVAFSKPFTVTEKVDGSLGVLYPAGDEWAIATRGSFTSEQAVKATELYRRKYSEFRPERGLTFLFEIVYPGNRIVVDYGATEDLTLLAVIETSTGRDVDGQFGWRGPVARRFDVNCHPSEVIDSLRLVDDGSSEGVVLRFDWPSSGPHTRVKVKLVEYKRIHKLLFLTTEKTVWEALVAGSDIAEVANRMPDEFHAWLRSTVDRFQTEFTRLDRDIRAEFAAIRDSVGATADRKTFAQAVAESENRSFLFKLLDEDPIADMIWKRLRPVNCQPFREQNEAVA